MKHWLVKNTIALIVLAVVIAGTLYVTGRFRAPGRLTVLEAQAMDMSAMRPPAGAPLVELADVRAGSIADAVTYTGEIAAYNEQDITPRITGTIVSLPVYPGDAVTAGELVAQLDTSEVDARADQAAASAMSAHDAADVIKVRGVDDLLVYRAKCCNPIRGEAIVGYVTRGKGVAVHSRMCPNVQSLMYDVERKIEVEWARAAEEAFPVRVVVHTDDRPGMLNQLTSLLSDENTNIRSLEAKAETDQDGGVVEMTVDVRDKKQLEKLVAAMRRISGVRDVERRYSNT